MIFFRVVYVGLEIGEWEIIMKVNANIVLAKCRTQDELYGMRVEERDGDWMRTWAFPMNQEMADREGFSRMALSGSFYETEEYPGCPYCGGSRFIVCAECKKISCYHESEGGVCRWCGYTAEVETVETLNVEGGED